METKATKQLTEAVTALGALAQEHRLETFRLLIQAGRPGLAAGVIAKRLGIAPSSLSFHLTALKHAGLVNERREARSKIYTANYGAMSKLIAYLMTNCCASENLDPQMIDHFSQGTAQ